MNRSDPRVSVVVPVHNCSKTISKCLTSLTNLDYPCFEIIIVDDGSTDETPQICADYAQVKTIRIVKSGASKARNVGISESGGEFIAFTDGDCIVEPDWLSELEKGFTGPRIAGVGGDQKCPDDETQFGVIIHGFLKSIGFVADYVKTDKVMNETEHNPTCNGMYRKEVLEEVGGFDESLWPGEDVDLDLKIRKRGYRLIYNPAACVAHYRPGSYAGFARMLYRYGMAQGYLVRKHGLFRNIHYVPILIALGLTMLAALMCWYPLVGLAVILVWPLLATWFTLKTHSFRRGIQFACLMLITLSAWNSGFVVGFFTRRGCIAAVP
jgi:glycosyltransferase involved in cell wall biosynthesis